MTEIIFWQSCITRQPGIVTYFFFLPKRQDCGTNLKSDDWTVDQHYQEAVCEFVKVMSQSPESVTSEAHGSPEPASQMAPEPTLPEEPTGSSTRPKQLSRNSSSRESSVSIRQDENEDASPDGVEKDEKTGGMGEGARNATRE